MVSIMFFWMFESRWHTAAEDDGDSTSKYPRNPKIRLQTAVRHLLSSEIAMV